MMLGLRIALLVGLIGSMAGCRKTPEAIAAEVKEVSAKRKQALQRRLAEADASPTQVKPVARWVLPAELAEISGLALTSNGQLLTHGDEQALIYVIDPLTGITTGRFFVGRGLRGDFEGITTVGNDIWLMQSNGRLYRFQQGSDGARVPYEIRETNLGKECEFEGIAYQQDSAFLVMPCKHITEKGVSDEQLLIYRVRLQGSQVGAISQLSVPIDRVVGENKWKKFEPSDITIDPNTGNYVIIASQQKGMIVLTPAGEVLRSEALPGRHPQAEGIAITKDNILIVSDEATQEPAVITLYRWRP
jgi:uncharacterized protein YjiK